MTWRPLPQPNEDREPVRITSSLDKVAKRFGTSSAIAFNGLFERWDELVGPSIAAHAKPVSLRRGHLRVEVDSTAWAAQLRFMTSDLVDRCCTALGPGAVKQIDIHVGRR